MYLKNSRIIIGVVVIILITAILTACFLNPFGIENLDKFIKFTAVTKLVNSVYYQDVDKEKAAENAISGVAQSMGDPYTVYRWGDEAKEYLEDLKGDFCGVGLYIEVDKAENLISVVSPILGGSAEKAGIITGDKIIGVNGVMYSGEQITEASKVMRGQENTEVTLRIRKAKDNSESDVTLVRKHIVLESVSGRMLDDKIGYVSISQFTENTAENLKSKLDELSDKGMKSLVIDLRNNPGGIMDEVVEAVSIFVKSGEVITYTEDKSGKRNDFVSSDNIKDTEKYNLPIIILANGGSASASEIMTISLRDYGLAKVVGEKTFGKGIVQSVLELGKEEILSITTARYFSPKGVCVHGQGIEPDIKVEMPTVSTSTLQSLTLQEDIQLYAAVKELRK